ncbi:MAG: LptF/LptG family permease [Alphaproteobacteria bacterium]
MARASGISVWGMLRPALVIVFAAGVLFVAFVNPNASRLNDSSRLIESILHGRDLNRRTQDVWFRQSADDNRSIIYAKAVDPDPLTLIGVTAIVLDHDGNFREKASAAAASFGESGWILDNATIVAAGAQPVVLDRYILSTNLSAEEIGKILTRPESQSVFSLPQFIETARDSGLKIDRFRYAFHSLLARPFYLTAMVVLAASFCLKLARSGGTGKLVLAGVISGFLLYVLSEFLRDLGGNGIVSAVFAAWAPPVIALTFGGTVLLYLEDG